MREIEPTRWDDIVLAILFLIVALPRAILAVVQDEWRGFEATTSIACVLVGLAILVHRSRR